MAVRGIGWWILTGLVLLSIGQVESTCECDNEPLGSIESLEVLRWLTTGGLSSTVQLDRVSYMHHCYVLVLVTNLCCCESLINMMGLFNVPFMISIFTTDRRSIEIITTCFSFLHSA
jgi:hypothetical protein